MQDLTLAARLFGRLLLKEPDSALIEHLHQPEVRAALRELNVELPSNGSPAALVERLSAEYCDCFVVGAEHVPLVQSLWEHGGYEQLSAQAMRELADVAGLELDVDAARNAPADHLGCILLLWAHVTESAWSEAQRHLTERHLHWARAPLTQTAKRDGFYAQVAAATLALIGLMENET